MSSRGKHGRGGSRKDTVGGSRKDTNKEWFKSSKFVEKHGSKNLSTVMIINWASELTNGQASVQEQRPLKDAKESQLTCGS